MRLSPPVIALVRRFHAHRPARIWSLIVTLYGDAIVPRGGSLWIGSLIDIMDLFDIDAGHVRTAISRLSSDGWLSRVKRGRASYYRLSRSGESEFLSATRRIYFDEHKPFDGRLRLALLTGDLADPAQTRRALADADFVPVTPTALVSLADLPPRLAGRKGVFQLRLDAAEVDRNLVATAWALPAVANAYRSFIGQFAPLDAVLRDAEPSGPDALVARTLLIHAFRRIVLRDPGLPTLLLPEEWPGRDARALAGRLYRRLVPASETLLDAQAQNEEGPLPPPNANFAQRFS